MDYVRAKPANDIDQADQRTEVIGRPRRPPQAADLEYRQMGGTQRDVVALPLFNRPGRDPVIEAARVEYITEDGRHQRRATDVQSRDDLQHPYPTIARLVPAPQFSGLLPVSQKLGSDERGDVPHQRLPRGRR